MAAPEPTAAAKEIGDAVQTAVTTALVTTTTALTTTATALAPPANGRAEVRSIDKRKKNRKRNYNREDKGETLSEDAMIYGCNADIIFFYPIPIYEQQPPPRNEELKPEDDKAYNDEMYKRENERLEDEKREKEEGSPLQLARRRVDMVIAMRAVGLVCVKNVSPDGTMMLLKVSATYRRLLDEAERLGIEMKIDPKKL
eukprot:2174765-Prymnesium_polylepis.1